MRATRRELPVWICIQREGFRIENEVVQLLGQILLTRRWHARHSQLAILVDIDMDTASGDIEGVEPGRQREESVEHVELESDGSQGYAHRRM